MCSVKCVRAHADGGTDQGEPGQHHLAHFLDPGEAHRIDVEPVGDRADEIAQEDADQQVDDRQNDQRRDDELREAGEGAECAMNSGSGESRDR